METGDSRYLRVVVKLESHGHQTARPSAFHFILTSLYLAITHSCIASCGVQSVVHCWLRWASASLSR